MRWKKECRSMQLRNLRMCRRIYKKWSVTSRHLNQCFWVLKWRSRKRDKFSKSTRVSSMEAALRSYWMKKLKNCRKSPQEENQELLVFTRNEQRAKNQTILNICRLKSLMFWKQWSHTYQRQYRAAHILRSSLDGLKCLVLKRGSRY